MENSGVRFGFDFGIQSGWIIWCGFVMNNFGLLVNVDELWPIQLTFNINLVVAVVSEHYVR